MIWLKRILPLALIAASWFAYTEYTERQQATNQRLAREYAQITAQVWLATAKYRDDKPRFIRVRDSLFEASGLTRGELDAYLQEYKDQPEFYTPYVRLVKAYVDSFAPVPTDSSLN